MANSKPTVVVKQNQKEENKKKVLKMAECSWSLVVIHTLKKNKKGGKTD